MWRVRKKYLQRVSFVFIFADCYIRLVEVVMRAYSMYMNA